MIEYSKELNFIKVTYRDEDGFWFEGPKMPFHPMLLDALVSRRPDCDVVNLDELDETDA